MHGGAVSPGISAGNTYSIAGATGSFIIALGPASDLFVTATQIANDRRARVGNTGQAGQARHKVDEAARIGSFNVSALVSFAVADVIADASDETSGTPFALYDRANLPFVEERAVVC